MNPIPIVLDTNILVAALRSRQGASFRLLSLLPAGGYVPNVSVPLFVEYQSVLKRPGLIEGLSPSEIDAVLNYFLSRSGLREIYYLWRPFLKDATDDMVLEVAVESQSAYIVTFNEKDFRGADQFGITVITPQLFLQQVLANEHT